ncbi:CPBP family intramembrane glutamic endopeptidase [Clostridium sp.]|uniref:CPBP family intramembrane glutamic endopeptidase n=1 Tax=Clostridium sp. TaxID=1506 RepID=UPI003D6C9416
MIKKLTKLQTILLVILIVFIGNIVILNGIPRLIAFFSSQLGYKISSKNQMTKYIVGTVVRIIGIVACFEFMKMIGIIKRFKWNFNKGYFAVSWLFFIYIIFNFEYTIISFNMISAVIMMIISSLFIGLYEEILFRGLILSLMFRHYGKTKKEIYFSVIFTSIVFGLFHFFNLFSGSSIISVVTQVVYATIVGIFFSALLLRTKNNLLWCALLHGLYDAANSFGDFAKKGTLVASSKFYILPYLINLAEFIPLLLLGLFLLRKVINVTIDGTVIISENS